MTRADRRPTSEAQQLAKQLARAGYPTVATLVQGGHDRDTGFSLTGTGKLTVDLQAILAGPPPGDAEPAAPTEAPVDEDDTDNDE